jgi:hypothetical protein
MIKKIIVSLILLGSLAFFEPAFLNRQVIGGIQLLIIAALLALTVLHIIYEHTPRIKPGFNLEISLISFAVLLSMFGANAYHDQSFLISMYAQRTIYFFLIYYFLHQLRPEPAFLVRMIVVIGIMWAVFYIIQWLAYPTPIFGSGMFMDRNTIRISLPGISFAVTAYYIGFHKFLKTNQYKYLFLLLLLLVVFTMLGTRQLIGPVFLISLIILVKSKRIQSKLVLTIFALISLIPIYFIFREIFDAMLEVSKQQSVSVNENIRVKAAAFYMYKFAPDRLSFFIGNGAYSAHSSYGVEMENYSKMFGYYLADIGIIGEFVLYGIVFVIAELMILFKLALYRYPENFQFIRYVSYSVFFSLFVSSGIFGSPEGIILICILLYFTDVIAYDKRLIHAEKPSINLG